MNLEDVVSSTTKKLEAIEAVRLDVLRAAVSTFRALYLDTGKYAFLVQAQSLRDELRKLEAACGC